MKTNVYVDGFNLYYACLEDTGYRWLDLAKLCLPYGIRTTTEPGER